MKKGKKGSSVGGVGLGGDGGGVFLGLLGGGSGESEQCGIKLSGGADSQRHWRGKTSKNELGDRKKSRLTSAREDGFQ